jgi:DNA gyrase subunit A
VKAILELRLHRLTALGRDEIGNELEGLATNIGELLEILANRARLYEVMREEFDEVEAEFATPRRSELAAAADGIEDEDLIEREEMVVTVTMGGYIKRSPLAVFREQKRGGKGRAGMATKEEDAVTTLFVTSTHNPVLFFSNLGRVYRLKAHEIPMKDRTARGTAVVNLLPLQPSEKIQAIIDTRDYETSRFLFFATRNGHVKKTKFTEYDSSLRAGIIAINLKDGDELVRVIPTNGGDDIFMVSRQGMTIRFAEDEVRSMGRAAAGVRGMKMKPEDQVVSVDVARDDVAILMVTDNGYGKRTQLDKFNRQGRGGQGVRGIRITARKGVVVAAFMVGLEDEILGIASNGAVIRMPVRDISSQGRDATGVKVMNVGDDVTVASVALVLQAEEEE